jgi:DNA-binding response OmpR family regulator
LREAPSYLKTLEEVELIFMKKIVYLDNSGFLRKVMRRFLTERGFAVESFDSGHQVLDILKTGEVAMVITGTVFADMSGLEFLKRVLISPYRIPIIVLTSNSSEDHRRLLKSMGVEAVIVKSGRWQDELLPYLFRS